MLWAKGPPKVIQPIHKPAIVRTEPARPTTFPDTAVRNETGTFPGKTAIQKAV